jgi:DNA-binding transcriptional regulator YhcF (GntR family)
MPIELDPVSAVPIYQQLRDRIVESIADGSLAPEAPLASVRQVAVEFGINVATVSKGYDLLRSEGLVRTNRKSGSVVARGPHSGPAEPALVQDWSARLTTLLAEATAQGMSRTQVRDAVDDVLSRFEPIADDGAGAAPRKERP